jgi:predicted GTPase
MIKGFENETAPLSEYEEKTLVPVFIRGLITKVGKDNSVTNKQIVTALKMAGYRISDTRVRKIINHIRINGLVQGVIATSDGYYIATSEQELEDYEQSLLGREAAIRAVRLSIARQRRDMFNKNYQQTLFT